MSKFKTGAPTPLSALLPGVLRQLQGEERLSLEQIGAAWERLVGSEASKHSWPRRLVGSGLAVEVENSGWMYELNLRKTDLLEGLIELLGAGRVRRLTLRMGEKKDA